MESILRDMKREQSKMQTDVNNLSRHYEKLASYVRQHVCQATMEWARLVVSHPKALLLIVETTRIVDETGYMSGESEPIRFTTLSLANGQIWDQLLRPIQSKGVTGAEYHGLSMTDLADKLTISEVWDEIAQQLEGHHIVIFGADYARNAVQTIQQTSLLDNAFCLHNKCKEFYGEFYELSLEKILAHQGIDKKRSQLTDTRERILVLFQVLRNLAAGMPMQAPEPETLDNSDDLDGHPF